MPYRQKVDAQPAFVLHSYPFRETSLIVDVFSRDYGRVALLARGARRARSALRGVMMAFQPLELSWAGKGEVQTLMRAEWQGGQPLLTGKALFCGYYINELLVNLLPREDAHPRLFSLYAAVLRRIATAPRESDLRCFERSFLQELGYGMLLLSDVDGYPVEADRTYTYEIERGPVRQEGECEATGPLTVRGKTLIDLAGEDFADSRSLQEAKQLMRTLIAHYLGGRNLETRKIFRELNEL